MVPKGVSNGNESPTLWLQMLNPSALWMYALFCVAGTQPGNKKAGVQTEVQGLAFDGGFGITKVELSSDSGETWLAARLDPDLGKYSWRRWHYSFTPPQKGNYNLLVKATNTKGETQPVHQWNRSGYMRNEIETLPLKAE